MNAINFKSNNIVYLEPAKTLGKDMGGINATVAVNIKEVKNSLILRSLIRWDFPVFKANDLGIDPHSDYAKKL